MEAKVIKSEAQYVEVLSRMEEIFDSPKDSKEGEELELLSVLLEKYENEKHPIDLPDPIEAIKFRMEQMGIKQ
jgi:HTH-type transcriptional regulator/antitoxin HigA